MAAFFKTLKGPRISLQTLSTAGSSMSVWVMGLDFQGRDLQVVADVPGVTCEKQPIKAPMSPDNREWIIRTLTSVKVHLEARTQEGSVWDTVDIVFHGLVSTGSQGTSVSAEDRATVFAAVKSGRILNAGPQLSAVEKNGFYSPDGTRKILLADAMFPTLAALSRGGIVNVLSFMRFAGGYHGSPVSDDTAVCSAIDIGAYDSSLIDLTTPEKNSTDPNKIRSTITGVAAVIRNLPNGKFAFGLTRPTAQDSGPAQPENDVFLPKARGEAPYKTWTYNASSQFVNAEAVSQVSAAFAMKAGVVVDRMFEDGRDHLHLQAISARS